MSNKSIYGQLMELNEPEPSVVEETTSVPTPPPPKKPAKPVAKPQVKKPEMPESSDSTHDSVIARNQDSKLSSNHDSIVEEVRRAVKGIGKDPFFGRFTPEEKRQLAEIAFAYNQQGTRTSENQIARIAVNYLLRDYLLNKEQSLLDKVLKALNE
jgi:hypothetical protein